MTIFRRKSPARIAIQPSGRYELLLALNEAAASLQLGARSETEVLRVFREQVEKLGLRGGISLVDEGGQNLVIRAFAPAGRLLKKFESMTGVRIEGYTFPISQVDVYREVIEERRPVYVAQNSEVLVQLLPAKARKFTQPIITALGAVPAIFVPIKSSDKTVGTLNVVGPNLTLGDLPIVQAFGNHLSMALDNARLFAAMQAEVNERTQAEYALRESGATFMALSENAAAAIFIYQGVKFRYVNAATENMTGYSRENLLEMNFWDVVHTEDQELIRQRGLARQRGEQVEQRYEFRIMRSDGEIRWVDFTAVSIEYEGAPAALGTAFDITDRKQVENALQASEQKFRSIVHNSTDGIVLANEQGKIIEWNIGMELITGLQRDQVIGKYLWDARSELLPAFENQPIVYETIKENTLEFLNHGDTPWLNKLTEQKIQRPNGVVRTIQEINFPVPTDVGYMIGSVVRDITEHHHIEEMVRRRAEELSTLNDLALDIATTRDFANLLHKIVERAAQFLRTKGGSLYLSNPTRTELRLLVITFPGTGKYIGTTLRLGEGAAGRVAEHSQPLIVDDYRNWDGRAKVFEADQPYNTLLSVPMIWQGEVLGVLQVMDEGETRKFTHADLELLTLFANQSAVAFENARLLEAERKRRQIAENLGKVTAALTSTLELDKVLEAILTHLREVVPYDSSTIFLLDGDTLRIVAVRGLPSNLNSIGHKYSIEDLLFKQIRKLNKPLVLGDAQADPRFQKWENTGQVHGWMGVPLMVRGKVIGVITLDSFTIDAYGELDAVLAETFANQAAIAIENARLYELAATERRHLSLLYEVGRELGASLDPVEILERAISLTCRALGGLVGQAFLYSGGDDRLSLQAIYGKEGIRLEDFNREVILHSGDGLTGWVAQHRQAVYVPDVSRDSRWLHVPMVDEKVRAAIVAPILAEERLLGVLSVLHMKPGAFSPNQLDLLQAICQEAGLALSNARRYQEVDRRLAEMTLIQNLVLTFSQRLEVQELLDEVIEQLVQKLGYPCVEIFLVDNEALIQKSYHGTEMSSTNLLLTEGVVGRVARTGEVALIHNVRLDPDYIPGTNKTVAELAVPIFNGKVVIGVINIESDQPDQLTVQDRDLLNLLAGQISIALENAVLYERVRQHADDLEQIVAQRTAELVELYELSQEIGFTLSYDDLLSMLLSHLRTAYDCDLVVGCLFVDGYNRIAIDSERPMNPKFIDEIQSDCLGEFPEPFVSISQQAKPPVKMISSNGRITNKPELTVLGSHIKTPITVSGRIAGFIMAGSEINGYFGREQSRLLDTFANQAAAAIQRLSSMLAAEQKRLESLVEHLPTGVLFLDTDYRLLVANPLGHSILDLLNGEDTGSQVFHLGPLEIEELIAHRASPTPLEISLDKPSHRVYEVQAQAVGEVDRQWLVTLRDVTQERETQMRIQMQDRLATVGQLAAGIAHDFNNIMAAILVYTDLLADDSKLPPESRDRLLVIQQQVQRAASLIRQILDFSRRSIMEQSTMDLLPFIKELDRILGRVLPETIQLELSYRAGSYLVNADPTRLQQVFMNLAVNARDAMPDGGELCFDLGSITINPQDTRPFPELADGEWITISVRDTGHGIPAEHLPHVFEPFFTTKPVGEGTGLGLAQVYGIIKQHDGFIDVISEVGRGTTFMLYLPALHEPNQGEPLNTPKEKFDGSGTSVLVVEDDRATLEALRALLESQNYHVLTARHGTEALELLQADNYHISLIVSDLVMPKMGGLALYRSIQERWPEVKMMFVTGHPLQGENQALLEKGEVMWLQKPFSVNEFNLMVKSLLV